MVHPPNGLGPPVEREGIIYTPVSVGSQGCLLYHIRIPGGQAPAALVYQSTDGQFSYGRPDQCVKRVGIHGGFLHTKGKNKDAGSSHIAWIPDQVGDRRRG